MAAYLSPGVYREDVFPAPPVELSSGVPAFLGYAAGKTAANRPTVLNLWNEFEPLFGPAWANAYLHGAVRGFFRNGGARCYVVKLDDAAPAPLALRAGLAALESETEPDLIAAPDLMRLRMPGPLPPDPAEVAGMQADIIAHCEKLRDRFAILDALPGADILAQRAGLRSSNAAIYYPWIRVQDEPGNSRFMPPSGHVAGVYARTDARAGVHKAPANETLAEVLDVDVAVPRARQDLLNPLGVNCIRALPGRGIRIWGARTLSSDSAWTYISTRRLFLSVGRWIAAAMPGVAFEPNDSRLWQRMTRELTAYLNGLHQRGALAGESPSAAFYVKCDGETNPAELRDNGQIVTEIGLRPGLPAEYIVVRIIHGAAGATIVAP